MTDRKNFEALLDDLLGASFDQDWPAEKKARAAVLAAYTDLEERERMRLAGISTAALGYWKEGDSIYPDYDTVALRDVAKLYAKYDELYQARDAAAGREGQPVAIDMHWQFVPKEPTPAMLRAMENQWLVGSQIDMAKREWTAAIAACKTTLDANAPHGVMPANLAHKLQAFANEPEGTINWKMIAWSIHRMLNAQPLAAPPARGGEGEAERLDSFRTLPRGWDSYDACTISIAAIDKAKELLRHLPAWGWKAAPVCDGSVQLEMHRDGFNIEINIDAAMSREAQDT